MFGTTSSRGACGVGGKIRVEPLLGELQVLSGGNPRLDPPTHTPSGVQCPIVPAELPTGRRQKAFAPTPSSYGQ